MIKPGPQKTTCYQCDMNCAFDVHYQADGSLERLTGPSCPRGAVQMEMQTHPERLRTPLKRVGPRGGMNFEPIGWDEALEICASQLDAIRQRDGAEACAFFSGYTKEARPHLQRLAHLFGSPNYMTESGCCFTATLVSEQLTYGYRLKTSSLQEAPETRCRLIWSTNPVHSVLPYGEHPIIRPKPGVKTIVVDPRYTETAQRADLHLPIRPGTDGALALAIHNQLFANGWADEAFLAKWANGIEAFKAYVRAFTPARASEICWVPEADIKQAAQWYATHGPAQLVLSATSTTQHSNGFQNHRAVILLAATAGYVDIPGGNRFFIDKVVPKGIDLFKELIHTLPPRVGQKRFPVWSNRYPAAHSMLLGEAIEKGDPTPIRGLFALGINPIMWPNTDRFMRALEKLDFFCMVDFFHTPGSVLADLILPAATSLEREALITASSCQYRGVVQHRRVVTPPQGEARPDAQIVLDLGCKLGMAEQFWHGDLHASIEEQAQGLTPHLWQRVQQEPGGLTVFGTAVMDDDVDEVTEKLYEVRGFPTPSGKIEFDAEELRQAGYDGLPTYKEPVESPLATPALAQAYPLVLTTGGRSVAYTHSQQRRFASLLARDPLPRVQIHSHEAAKRAIAHGDTVTLSSPRGAITMVAQVDDTIRPGIAHAYHGWAQANVNRLTEDDLSLDPISGFPAFKSSLCQIAKAD
ncbi:molybdopterin oxidoreductase [Magnetococcus marinus MC-1]|uniref:Molybdopterin oxidoreductase n=1 Tax=Magnetococcus marinus (strain ATCC BAA-1437 / JCM 17883 / MC-1) TaxID=156889 RepID=A0L7Z6_MAGMM|nr:molybdopterin-dependent oxidoreductase [Magnetococcus marinus]ABK44089.1 molybdopterin oxidoreductase [Magnetococcus marinus MC-1]